MISVTINPANDRAVVVDIERRDKATTVALTSAVRAGTIHLTTVLKRDVLSGQILNRRSGNLSRAIHHRMDGDTRGLVGVGPEAAYAEALNNGARPHIIEAKNGKALAFVPGGAAHAIRNSAFIKTAAGRRAAMQANTIFRRRVNHPGNPPYRFMEIALKMATPGIRQIVSDRIAAALQKGSSQ